MTDRFIVADFSSGRSIWSRRQFLWRSAGLILVPQAVGSARSLKCDVAVIGSGFGGVAAAHAAARHGQRVILTEETNWIGGQVTSQAVPPAEHAWIESFGCTRTYRVYRDGVRDYYRRHYPLTEPAKTAHHLNPDSAVVSRIAHEPRVSLAVLEAMLAPYVSSGRVTVLLPDTLGIGSYRIDLHMSTGRDNDVDISSLPFQIPLGALIPLRVENLLPACKTLGTTHITNGCYRLHPVEWNLGEAAGCLAAQARQTRKWPREIRGDARALADFQALLQRDGVELARPRPGPR